MKLAGCQLIFLFLCTGTSIVCVSPPFCDSRRWIKLDLSSSSIRNRNCAWRFCLLAPCYLGEPAVRLDELTALTHIQSRYGESLLATPPEFNWGSSERTDLAGTSVVIRTYEPAIPSFFSLFFLILPVLISRSSGTLRCFAGLDLRHDSRRRRIAR